MDIRHLKYFTAIAEAPSLSAASQMLGITQPSLSQIVQRMEKELNVTLLVRSPRGIALTEEGDVLLGHAERITREFDRCMTSMKDLCGEVGGQVNFGMPPSVAMVLATPLAETIRLEMPDVRLKVVEAISGYFVPWLEDGSIDVAMMYHTEGVEHLETRHLLNEQLYFCSAPDAWPFDFSPEGGVPFKMLEKVDMILPSTGVRKLIRRYEEQSGVNLNVALEMDSMRQIIELVARGSGYGLFAPSAVTNFVNRGELVRSPVLCPVLTLPVYMVWQRAGRKTRASRAVEDLTLAIVSELVRRGIWEGTLGDSLELKAAG